MIMADSFIHSSYARDLEFQVPRQEVTPPTVIQFAARNPFELAMAVKLTAPFVEGIDLNCGCPQGWALQEGIGAGLMKDPQLIHDMVRGAVANAGSTPISVKIRIHPTPNETIELARRIEAAGAVWLTVHGRTRRQKSSEPVDYEMIRLLAESLSIPVIANGDIFTLSDAQNIYTNTGVAGVMAARGLLENPALFAGYRVTPWEGIERFVQLSLEYGSASTILQHHLAKMMDSILTTAHKRLLNSLSNASIPTLLDFLEELRPSYYNMTGIDAVHR